MGERTEEHRRARRAAAMLLHPDRGGDADTFAAVLEAIDRAFTTQDPAQASVPEPPAVVFVAGRAALWRRHLQRVRPRPRPTRHGRW
ncbi:hypothetical protein [Rhodococcus sp. YH1]|uniref:hypothetical protein n=1 Tax=Rhodococcus sp. YH1 TaxID=89066 RepID=UPI001387314D|nr:hypothetical protein [Rhodococcus sp. YH1]